MAFFQSHLNLGLQRGAGGGGDCLSRFTHSIINTLKSLHRAGVTQSLSCRKAREGAFLKGRRG